MIRSHFYDRGNLSELVLLVLAHLESGPLHAAAIIALVEQYNHIFIEPGTLYRILVHIEQKGWVETGETDSQFRSYYLTVAGINILSQQRSIRHKPHSLKYMPDWMEGFVMPVNWLLRLYPRGWRERYEAEMRALLEQHTITPLTIFDMLLAALAARFDPQFKTQRIANPIRRLSQAGTAFICVFPVFLLAQMFWAIAVTDPSGALYDVFKTVANVSSVVAASNSIIDISVLLIWLAVLAGGLLCAAALIRRAYAARRKRLLLAGSFLGLLTLLSPLATVLLFTLNASQAGATFFFIFVTFVFLGPLSSMFLAIFAFIKGNVGRQIGRLLLVPATLATIAMITILVANIVGAISAWTYIFQSQSFGIPFSTFQQWFSGWAFNFVFMALPTLIALFTLIRGIRALKTPATPASPLQQMPLQEQQ